MYILATFHCKQDLSSFTNVLYLGTEAVVDVTGEVSFHNRNKRWFDIFLLGASGCIWCSLSNQIQVAKVKSFCSIFNSLGFNGV